MSSDKSGRKVSRQNLDMDHTKFRLVGILRKETEVFLTRGSSSFQVTLAFPLPVSLHEKCRLLLELVDQ